MLLTVPMDAAHVRTLWLRGNSAAAAAIFSAVGAVKLVILVLEAVEKRGILLPEYLHLSPEDTSGLYGRGVFWWLNPMFMLGYRGVIKDEDLYSTDGDLSSTVVNQRFQRQWAKCEKTYCLHIFISNSATRSKQPKKARSHHRHGEDYGNSIGFSHPASSSSDFLQLHATIFHP
jgi:ATP-binding cassette subfamily C (CFTR/MRP) protein 1